MEDFPLYERLSSGGSKDIVYTDRRGTQKTTSNFVERRKLLRRKANYSSAQRRNFNGFWRHKNGTCEEVVECDKNPKEIEERVLAASSSVELNEIDC